MTSAPMVPTGTDCRSLCLYTKAKDRTPDRLSGSLQDAPPANSRTALCGFAPTPVYCRQREVELESNRLFFSNGAYYVLIFGR